MKIEIETNEIKQSLSSHHLSDIVLYMAWIFIHIGFFSLLRAEEFFIIAGLVNFVCALGYKVVNRLFEWKV